MNRILTFLVSLIFVSTLHAQAYTINLAVKGEKNKDALLVMHYGTGKYSIDTAAIDKNGKAVFTGDRPLVPGMYLIAIEGGQILDFLISDTVNQKFSISTTKGKYLETLSFKNSPENEAFADYSRFLIKRQKREAEIAGKTSDKKPSESVDREIKLMAEQTNEKVAEIQAKFPGSLLESVAISMNPLQPDKDEVPESPDSARRYLFEFYKNHYWDRLTLTDRRMQNTPILIPAIDNYFKNMILQIPDTIIRAVDLVLPKAESDTAMMRFLTGHIFNKYVSSKIMGMENVVVHIIENYYLSGKVNVKDEKFNKNITEYLNKNKETLIGKKAKDLKMETVNGSAESLYDIDSPYILVCFYESSCSHCKDEMPKIYKIFKEFKDRGLTGFCVYTQKNKNEWVEFISKNQMTDWINVWDPNDENDFRTAYSVYSVPQVYVLDKDMKIVGRGLESMSLAQLLHHLIKK
ncbi:MAG: redoxin domain-containing protein [Prevotellaceae bacterium]|nr:redoxin domain-containing protein [Prevotellaceae bacterium]